MKKRQVYLLAEGSLLIAATAFILFAYNQPHNGGYYKLFDKANAYYMALVTMLLAMEWSRKHYILGIIGYIIGFATLWNAKDYFFHTETKESVLEYLFGFLLLITAIYLIVRRKHGHKQHTR